MNTKELVLIVFSESFNKTVLLCVFLYAKQINTHLPPPTFCYIFSVTPSLGYVNTIEGDPISDLYQPPVVHCLREILQVIAVSNRSFKCFCSSMHSVMFCFLFFQTDEQGARCSFYARVIYQRPQVISLSLSVCSLPHLFPWPMNHLLEISDMP